MGQGARAGGWKSLWLHGASWFQELRAAKGNASDFLIKEKEECPGNLGHTPKGREANRVYQWCKCPSICRSPEISAPLDKVGSGTCGNSILSLGNWWGSRGPVLGLRPRYQKGQVTETELTAEHAGPQQKTTQPLCPLCGEPRLSRL